MSEASHGADRRRCERALLKTDLFYSVEAFPELKMKTGSFQHTGCLVDLSERGIGFVSETEFVDDAKLEIVFDLVLKDGKSVKIQAVGVVRYCFLQCDYKTFRVGLEFIKIKGGVKKQIIEYIKDFRNV